MNPKVVLIIMDGWGLAPAWGGNAIEMAQTPNIDTLWRKFPHASLKAAEEAVGLPRHEPGNSEVGHLNIGCGQIVFQNLPGITAIINDGTFYENKILIDAFGHAKEKNSNLHLIGMVSDGGVHSFNGHLYALLEMAKKQDFTRVYIHVFTDGRDTDPMKALSYLSDLNEQINRIGFGRIESISGRYYAMDRDKHWDRTQKTYDVITSGVGPISESAQKAISDNYRQNITDEFIIPTVIQSQEKPFVPINDNDSIIFFNFRSDRARQLTAAIAQHGFRQFERKKILNNLYFCTFAFLEEYVGQKEIKPVFQSREIKYSLARILSEANLKQLHIAETEKYAHVTYFFNGGKETPFDGEERALIQSPRVATFDLKPEMSAGEITKKVLSDFTKFDFTVCNFANPDMVGHSGNIKATIRACETVDQKVGEIVKTVLDSGAVAIITADHGNAEQKINPNSGEPYTEHTINPVPFILCSNNQALNRPLRQNNERALALSDIAPTIIDIMKLNKPAEMSGVSLLIHS